MLLLILLALCMVSHSDCLIRCFECTDSPHPADCLTITLCLQYQKCMLQEYVTSGGLVLYRSGCMSKLWCDQNERDSTSHVTERSDVEVCAECCDGELCNNQGCGLSALPLSMRGPYCYNCPLLHDPGACRTLDVCVPGEICMVQEVSSMGASGHKLYGSSCVSQMDCSTDGGVTLIGKRDKSDLEVCYSCCHTDFCNNKCDVTTPYTPSASGNVSATPTTSTQPTPTPTPTTTTTRPTTIDTKQAHCEHHGYTYVRNIPLCYKFHFELKYWTDANNVCMHEGGTLAVLDSQAKWAYLKPKIEHEKRFPPDRIFIGLRDPHHNGHYSWVDGSHSHFTAWAHDQPDNGEDDCASVAADDHFKWHDMPCHHHHYNSMPDLLPHIPCLDCMAINPVDTRQAACKSV